MAPSLSQSRALADIAVVLCSFLPGSGNAAWKGHLSFKSVAEKIGAGDLWQPGSKLPMITALLEGTLATRRGLFEPLILEVVRAGLVYRQNKGEPIRADEIEKLNGLLLEVGFRFPDLWDTEFRASLLADGTARAKEHVDRARTEQRLAAAEQSQYRQNLDQLQQRFLALHGEADRAHAGLELEDVLNRLFGLSGLEPRSPFRVVGEQIDGSFELDHEIYLVEAKWTREPCAEGELLVFRGKIEGKSQHTRGVFISVNGVTRQAAEAITQGKQPSFFVTDGHDLAMVLGGEIELPDFLRQRQRLLAEEGRVVVPFAQLRRR